MKTPSLHFSWISTFLFLLLACASTGFAADSVLRLSTRARVETAKGSGEWQVIEKTIGWEPRQTAIVICDMWDKHTCAGATRRVAEMAPRMNELVKKARGWGAFIIHCPSDTMKFYEGTPGRKLAQAAPKVETAIPLQRWCHLDKQKEAPLPIDDSDGGCDTDSPWPKGAPYPWTRQIATIEIHDGDAITDSAEAYYLMRQRGITNVIVMGVHLNMCVLGRPFSIRQMVNQGQNVLLVRDLTDTMYNPRRSPYVAHCIGNDLMVEHVERYWCPTISSVALLGGSEFHFSEDKRPHAVFLIGEDEYKTWETLPDFAKKNLEWRGWRVSIIQQDAQDKHRFPGLIEALGNADLLFVSTRRRALPQDQLDAVRAYLNAGKPLVGIRTASHGFAPRGADVGKGAAWTTFDPEVLGGNYNNHYGSGPKTSVRAAPGEETNALLTGVHLEQFFSNGSLYKVSPLKQTANPLLIGSIPSQPAEPVAWTHSFGEKQARVFYTSLGHPDDFANPSFRRLLLNGMLWATGQPIPPTDSPLVRP
jgi:type 1 glutamine amidotransferase/nicotinamidase-related amidase